MVRVVGPETDRQLDGQQTAADGPVLELLRACLNASKEGADFPTIWRDLLKVHPLVIGIPIQKIEGKFPVLEVNLREGSRIVFGRGSITLR